MSATKHRIAQHTRSVKEAGLRGLDMTAELRKVAQLEDLSANEIRRIAEDANRQVQLEKYKLAGDKRFKFALADGVTVAKEAEAACKTVKRASTDDRYAAIDQASGDPFAPPERYDASGLSVLNAPIRVKLAAATDRAADREKLAKLDLARLDVEALIKEARALEITTASHAKKSFEAVVQSAKDLVTAGITLPSLYEAIIASMPDTPDRVQTADDILGLIIDKLRKDGVPAHKMGFRHKGRPDLLEKLTTDDLLTLCHRASGYVGTPDLTMCDVKTSEYFEAYAELGNSAQGTPIRPVDSENDLVRRGSQNGIYGVPQVYLGDDAKNQVRVINGDHEFVIGITDLVGDQTRMRKCHAAQEYLGLKLKQIEWAMRNLDEVNKEIDAYFDAKGDEAETADKLLGEKHAWAGLVAGAAKAVSKLPAAAKAVGSFVKKEPMTAMMGAGMASDAVGAMRNRNSGGAP